jgi:hypothetical protein
MVFVDHVAANTHLGPYNIPNIHGLSDLDKVLSAAAFRYAMVVCGGHGSPLGLQHGTGQLVSPHALLSAVKKVQGAEISIVFLCQCFAGTFHFMDATAGPIQFILIGSTNFYPTISTGMQLKVPVNTSAGTPGLAQWGANLYQVGLFEWLSNPKDIDGDGAVTLIDAYKYAGITTIQRIQEVWTRAFSELRKEQDDLAAAEQRGEQQVVLDAHRTKIRQIVSILYNIQEPWLLHARLAAQIGFV